MKAQAIIEHGKPLREIESETPEPRGTEVLIRVTHCGVCHSDVHLHEGHFDIGGGKQLDIRRKLPFTLGHEVEGEVAALGPDAEGVRIGEHRVVFPWIGCGECRDCKRGDTNLCDNAKQIGVQVSGGYATHVMVPHPRYLLDCGNIPPGLAATYMCSGLTSYSALTKVGPLGADERVMIVGLGGVGFMGLQFAKAMFANAPLVADIDSGRRAAAKKAGAHQTYDPSEKDAVKQVVGDTDGGVAAAVDFVGSETSLQFASSVVRKGGKVIVVGLFGGTFSIPVPMFPLRVITLAGTYVGTLKEARAMMELVRAGKIDAIPIETRPLDEAGRTLDDLRAGRITGRVVLTP